MSTEANPFELLDSFISEVRGYLPTIRSNVETLASQQGDSVLLEESHRFAHTIKSSSGMMGMPLLRKLALPMEQLLSKAYAGEVAITPEVVGLIDGTLNRIELFLDDHRDGGKNASVLIRANDAAYSAVKFVAPTATLMPPSQDALERRIHSAASSDEPVVRERGHLAALSPDAASHSLEEDETDPEELSLLEELLKSGKPIDDTVLIAPRLARKQSPRQPQPVTPAPMPVTAEERAMPSTNGVVTELTPPVPAADGVPAAALLHTSAPSEASPASEGAKETDSNASAQLSDEPLAALVTYVPLEEPLPSESFLDLERAWETPEKAPKALEPPEQLPAAPITALPPDVVDEPPSEKTVAAEWLTELLSILQSGKESSDTEDRGLPNPSHEMDSAHSTNEQLASEVTPSLLSPILNQALEQMNADWERRLEAERAALEQQLAEERKHFAQQMEEVKRAHDAALRKAALEQVSALDVQRADLENQVRNYIEDQLKPELEDTLRDELSREFQLSFLVEPQSGLHAAAHHAPTPIAPQTSVSKQVDAGLSAEMREVFAEEANEHLQLIGEMALRLHEQPDDIESLASLRRTVHTLKGAAGMVGEQTISQLCHQMESVLDAALEDRAALGTSTFSLVMESCDVLSGLVGGDELSRANAVELIGRLSEHTGIVVPQLANSATTVGDAEERAGEAPRHLTPRSRPNDEFAAEMRAVFAEEASEHLQAISAAALQLRQRNDDVEGLASLRRSVHTLKGAAGMVGELAVNELCHTVESVLDHVLDGRTSLTEPMFNVLMESCDAMAGLIDLRDGAEMHAAALIVHLHEAFGSERPLSTDGAANVNGQLTSAVAAQPAVVLAEDSGEPRETVPTSRPRGDAPNAVAATGPALRMGIRQFDEVLDANHELFITHSAVDQRLSQLAGLSTDLGSAGTRLRQAAMRLEGSNELIRLLANPQQAALPLPLSFSAASSMPGVYHEGASDDQSNESSTGDQFDTLELDRYTDLHRLASSISEASLDVELLRNDLDRLLFEMRQLTVQQHRTFSAQNAVLLGVRTFPLQALLPKVAQTAYAVASRLGKSVEVTIDGGHTLLDRAAMEPLADAILHLVRNSVDHGIESPEERQQAGKPPTGTIRLAARRQGAEVVLTLSDDGRGLDTERIRTSAIHKGLLSPRDLLSKEQVWTLIFEPGFSTAQTVTDVSGRGVGMDVVRTNIESLRGRVDVDSELGRGTAFLLSIPSSLSLLSVTLVESAGFLYALPLAIVRHAAKLPRRRFQQTDRGLIVRHGDLTYSAYHLGALLGRTSEEAEEEQRSLLFVETPTGISGVIVDRLVGTQSVVVKQLGQHLRSTQGVFGATVLGTGDLVLILDIPSLLRAQAQQTRKLITPVARGKRVLIVDDSASVRHVTGVAFRQSGWQTEAVRDGQEALEKIQEWRPDAIVSDIEMPRMDGFELLAILKREPTTSDIPVIVVTSRAGDKHRDRARQLGVDGYLVKPFQEDELIALAEQLAFGNIGALAV